MLLFGVPSNMPKDENGTSADSPDTPVILAVELLRETFPDLTVACDVSVDVYSYGLYWQLDDTFIQKKIVAFTMINHLLNFQFS